VREAGSTEFDESDTGWLSRPGWPRSHTSYLGRQFLRFILSVQGLGAFVLIILGVMSRKARVARASSIP